MKPQDIIVRPLKSPGDVMMWMDAVIEYGSINKDGVRQPNSLGGHDFRQPHRTLGLEETLSQRIGACIEQNNVSKFLLDSMGISARMFCPLDSLQRAFFVWEEKSNKNGHFLGTFQYQKCPSRA